MLGYFRVDVIQAAVAYFYIILVKHFMKFVVTREVLLKQFQEMSANVCLNGLAEWGIEPYDVMIEPYDHMMLLLRA